MNSSIGRSLLFVALALSGDVAKAGETAEDPNIPSDRLIFCIRRAELQMKGKLSQNVDAAEDLLTRIRLQLPWNHIPEEAVMWQPPCSASENVETTAACEYGLYEKSHPILTTLNQYSIGPYQMRPSVAFRMESTVSRLFNRPLRSPRKVIEDLVDVERAKPSISAYLWFLASFVKKSFRAPTPIPPGVWATLYNEGQVAYRVQTHGARIVSRVNKFGRLVDACMISRPGR